MRLQHRRDFSLTHDRCFLKHAWMNLCTCIIIVFEESFPTGTAFPTDRSHTREWLEHHQKWSLWQSAANKSRWPSHFLPSEKMLGLRRKYYCRSSEACVSGASCIRGQSCKCSKGIAKSNGTTCGEYQTVTFQTNPPPIREKKISETEWLLAF